MRRLVVLLVVALVLGCLWLVLRASPERTGGTAPAPSVPIATETPTPAREPELDGARTAAEPRAAEPVPPPDAEPVAAPARPDPTEAELEVFAKECAPGTIEGIVLRGKEPVGGGKAWLSTGALPWGTPQVWDATVGVRRTDVGADGLFRFEGLGPETYGVGVSTPDGAARHAYVTLPPDLPIQRVRFVLGEGGVRGHVYDEHGIAVAGWQIAVYNWGNTLAGVQVIGGCESDAQGAFEYAGLVGGNYVISAGPIADRRDPQTRTVFFELKASEWKTVDVGTPPGGSTWTGRVLTPRGEPFPFGALAELHIESDAVQERVQLSPESGFEVRLAAGTYKLSLLAHYAGGAAYVTLGEITLREGAFVQDVTLPRALVRVRAKYAGSRRDPPIHAWLKAPDFQRAGLRGNDGAEYFLGIEAGDYTLSCSPAIRDAPDGRVPVTVRAQDDEVDVDVVVRDP